MAKAYKSAVLERIVAIVRCGLLE